MAETWNNFIESLYKKEYKQMVDIAYRITGSRELAQDMVHEAFVLALFRQTELRVHPNPSAWLVITIRNFIQNEHRRNIREGIPLEEAVAVSKETTKLSLEHLLPIQLQESDRLILIYRFEYQLSHKEIAEILNISEEASRRRLAEALARCKRFLRDS